MDDPADRTAGKTGAEIVPLGAPYETAVLVLEDSGQEVLLVRGNRHGNRRRASVWCLPTVRLREGDDPARVAARGCEDLTGFWPPRLRSLTVGAAGADPGLAPIHAFHAQRRDLVVRPRAGRTPRETRWLPWCQVAQGVAHGEVGGRVTLLILDQLLHPVDLRSPALLTPPESTAPPRRLPTVTFSKGPQ